MKGPLVGVGVFAFHGDRFLIGLRRGAHGAGEWSLPGGHLEPGEAFMDCCKREVLEETGIEIEVLRKLDFTQDFFKEEDLHYVTLFFVAKRIGGKLVRKEPDKCAGWAWIDRTRLLRKAEHGKIKLFPPLRPVMIVNAMDLDAVAYQQWQFNNAFGAEEDDA